MPSVNRSEILDFKETETNYPECLDYLQVAALHVVASSLTDNNILLLFDFLYKYLVGDSRAEHHGNISLNYLDAQVLVKRGEILDLQFCFG